MASHEWSSGGARRSSKDVWSLSALAEDTELCGILAAKRAKTFSSNADPDDDDDVLMTAAATTDADPEGEERSANAVELTPTRRCSRVPRRRRANSALQLRSAGAASQHIASLVSQAASGRLCRVQSASTMPRVYVESATPETPASNFAAMAISPSILDHRSLSTVTQDGDNDHVEMLDDDLCGNAADSPAASWRGSGAPHAAARRVSSAAYDRNGTPPILDSSRPVALTGLQSPLAVKPFQAHGMTTFRPVAQRANNMI